MKIKIIIYLLIFSIAAKAQEIHGQITDASTAEPLPGANIMIGLDLGATADGDGLYRIKVDPGTYSIRISFVGYENYTEDKLQIGDEGLELNIALVPLATGLGEVVVSAGKFEQRLEEVTVSLDVIKPQLVQDKNLVNLRTALQQAPGVNITDGQANIRGGSGWSYGAGTRVQTLIDGMPLISGDANQVLWDLVPIWSVERLEVLKGASSVLYGSAALNGVINVLTHSMPSEQRLSANLYSGFYDAPQRESLKWWDAPRFNSGFNFDYQQPLNENNGLVLGGGYGHNQGFRYLENESRTRLFAKFLHRSKKVKGLEAEIATHIMYSDLGNTLLWENDSLGYIPADSGITRTSGWDYYVDPVLRYRHGKFRHSLQGRFLKVNNNAFDGTTDFSNSSDLYLGQYLLQYFHEKMVATFGASSSHTVSEAVLFEGEHSSANNALFLQLDYKAWDRLNLNAGVRYETFRLDEREDAKPVFRAGANFQILQGTFLRASYGEAFRFPSVAEAFTATSVGALRVYPNPELKAETGQTLEAGVRQVFASKKLRGYVDFAVFDMRYYDMIEYTAAIWGPSFFSFGFAPLNIGETKIRGFEIASSLEGESGEKLRYRVLAGYTYSNPRIPDPTKFFANDSVGEINYLRSSLDSSGILKYRYQHLAKMDAQIGYGMFHLGFSIRYNDFMQNIDRIFTDIIPGVAENRLRNASGDLVVDARVGVSFDKHWRTDLIVENLFNREVMIRPAYLGPPRSIVLRVNYSLGE